MTLRPVNITGRDAQLVWDALWIAMKATRRKADRKDMEELWCSIHGANNFTLAFFDLDEAPATSPVTRSSAE